jgi:hypothetical protein
MFKRMVTMRKALHKREEDTTPRGVESDELVEELGRERSKTQRARKSRDTALEGSRRYEQLDRRRVADLKTSQESFSQRENALRDDCDRLVHQRDQLRDQLIDEEDAQRKLRREIKQLRDALQREQNKSVVYRDEAKAADARAQAAQEESENKLIELSVEQDKAERKARDAEQALAERDALIAERDALKKTITDNSNELVECRERTKRAEEELASRKANQDSLEEAARSAAVRIADAENSCNDTIRAAQSACDAEVSLAKRGETAMRFKLDASSAKQASLQSENDKAKANEQHAEHRASIAEMSANDAAAAGSLRELAAKLLDDQEDPSIGAARMLDRVWDLVDELLAFAGFGAAQDALRAERTCPGRQPPPVAAFLGAGEAQKYANTAADSLIECLRGERRATFEKRWLRHVPIRAQHQQALARLRVTCAALFALGSCRKRRRAHDMTDAPSGAEERASYAALKDALLAVNKENTYNVLSELKKPWSHETFAPLFQEGDDQWLLLKEKTCDELRDVFVKELPRVAPPKLLVLFRAYETWQSGLVQATLHARQEKAHVSKAALELLVVCAWLVHDVEQARGVATVDDDDDDCGTETLKGGNFVEGRPARVLLRVKTRLNDIQKALREHGAFSDVETNVPDIDNKGAKKALALWLPPPLDGPKLRASADTPEVLAALCARLPDADAGDLRTAATLQVLIREDILGVMNGKLVARLSSLDMCGRLVTCLTARVAAHAEGRQYLLLGVASEAKPFVPYECEDSEEEEEMEECAEIIQQAWRAKQQARQAAKAFGARFFEDSEEEEQDEAVREIQAAWRKRHPAPKKASPKKKLVAKVDGDVVDALLSLVMKEETRAQTAYAAVALQRLTLEDVIAKRVAGESGRLIERVRSVEGVVAAALSASLVNSLADHASEVSEPIQAIHLLLEGVNKARDVENTGEAIVERLLGAAYCLAQTPTAKAAFEEDAGFELLSEPLDELLGDERERMRSDATKRTFAFEVSCVSDALRGIAVQAPSESPPPAQTPPPIEAVFLGGDQLEEFDEEACVGAPAAAPDYERHL